MSGVFHVNEVSRNFFFVTWLPLQMVFIYFLENLTFTIFIVPFNPCSPWLPHPPFNLLFHIQMAIYMYNRCINSSLSEPRACGASQIEPCLIVHLVSIQLTGCHYLGYSKPLGLLCAKFQLLWRALFRNKRPVPLNDIILHTESS